MVYYKDQIKKIQRNSILDTIVSNVYSVFPMSNIDYFYDSSLNEYHIIAQWFVRGANMKLDRIVSIESIVDDGCFIQCITKTIVNEISESLLKYGGFK